MGTDVRTTKSKKEFVGVNLSHHTFPYFAHKTPILDLEVLKIHGNIK